MGVKLGISNDVGTEAEGIWE